MFNDPAVAALIGWLVAMTSRQIGHLVFEPKDYDVVNQATHQYKEAIKVGYNLRRKIVLMTIWLFSPLLLVLDPTLLGWFVPHRTLAAFARHVGYLWLALGLGGLLFRTVQLFLLKDLRTGLVWATKILTDPFHDIKLYYPGADPAIPRRGRPDRGCHAIPALKQQWLSDFRLLELLVKQRVERSDRGGSALRAGNELPRVMLTFRQIVRASFGANRSAARQARAQVLTRT